MLQEQLYRRDQTIIKVYGTGDHRKIKVITLNSLRVGGVEERSEFSSSELQEEYEEKLGALRWQLNPDIDAVKDLYRLAGLSSDELAVDPAVAGNEILPEKMREAKSRARARIFELAFCNPWQWFFTGTLNSQKYDRTNLNKWHKDLTQWLRDFARNRKIPKIDFLLIPELHADGKSWHMHGLINGLPVEHLQQFQLGDQMSSKLAWKVRNGETIYNWQAYADKFGFCDLEPVRDYEAVSKYCTKYITKSLQHSVTESGAHLYYHSRGLATPELVCVGTFGAELPAAEYGNDYCSVAWMDYTDENLRMLREGMLKEPKYASRGKGFAMVVPDRDGLPDRERDHGAAEPDPVPAY